MMRGWFQGLLAVGTVAPDFELRDESGNPIRLSSFQGVKNVVLVWYPADDTRICTQQLCELRDAWPRLTTGDTVAFGVNPQGAESHDRFRRKHALPFPLLVDRGQKVGQLYGTAGLVARRTVYAIGKDGRVRGAWRGTPSTAEVLLTLESR